MMVYSTSSVRIDTLIYRRGWLKWEYMLSVVGIHMNYRAVHKGSGTAWKGDSSKFQHTSDNDNSCFIMEVQTVIPQQYIRHGIAIMLVGWVNRLTRQSHRWQRSMRNLFGSFGLRYCCWKIYIFRTSLATCSNKWLIHGTKHSMHN